MNLSKHGLLSFGKNRTKIMSASTNELRAALREAISLIRSAASFYQAHGRQITAGELREFNIEAKRLLNLGTDIPPYPDVSATVLKYRDYGDETPEPAA